MLEYLCSTNKRQEIIHDINKLGVERQTLENVVDLYDFLFKFRKETMDRDLVGMEEVKAKL